MRRILSWVFLWLGEFSYDVGVAGEVFIGAIADAVGWMGYRIYVKCLRISESLQGHANNGPWER